MEPEHSPQGDGRKESLDQGRACLRFWAPRVLTILFILLLAAILYGID